MNYLLKEMRIQDQYKIEEVEIIYLQIVNVKVTLWLKLNRRNNTFTKLKEDMNAAELHEVYRCLRSINVLFMLVVRRGYGLNADAIKSRDDLGASHWRSLLHLYFTLSASTNYPSNWRISNTSLFYI